MRILSVHIYSENNNIKLRFETIKSKTLSKNSKPRYGGYKLSNAESLLWQGYCVQQNKYGIKTPHAGNEATEKSENIFLVNSIVVDLHDHPLMAFNLLKDASKIFNESKCDHVFVDSQSIKDHILFSDEDDFSNADALNTSKKERANLVYNVDVTINDYIQSKTESLKTTSLFEYLTHKVITINPALDYLEAFQLINPDVNDAIKQTILKKIVRLAKDKNDLKIVYDFMKSLHHYAVKTLINPCLGQKAHCGDNYEYNYTELTLLEHAKIHLRDDGRASFKLADNWSYKCYYAKGCQNDGILEDELRHLGNIIGLEFSPDSIFNSEIIFTPACTELLFKKGLLYDTAYLNQFIKSNSLDKETNEVIAVNQKSSESNRGNVSQAGMFSQPDMKPTEPDISKTESSYPKEKPLFDEKRGMFYWGKRIDELPSQESSKPDLDLNEKNDIKFGT